MAAGIGLIGMLLMDAMEELSEQHLEKFDGNGEVQISCGRRRFVGSGGIGPGPGEGLGKGQSPCGAGLGDALQLPKKDIAGAMRVLRAPEAGSVRRMRGGSDHRHLGRVKVELLVSTYCFAGCTGCGRKKFFIH